MQNKEIWPLVEATTFAFGPFYQLGMSDAIDATGAADIWFPLSLVRGADPAAFDLERFLDLNPYSQPDRQLETLEKLAEMGLLQQEGQRSFRLTQHGREAVERIFTAAHHALAELSPLPATEMEELAPLLSAVVSASLEAVVPEKKWNLRYSRWTDPGEGASQAARIDQYLTDMIRFREDCHIAAWSDHDLTGPALEALTLIWRGEASSTAEITEELAFRSYAESDYAREVDGLADRGWVLASADGYTITPSGSAARQAIEDETTRLFTSPFATLTPQDQARLESLIQRLNDRLQAEGRLLTWESMYSLSTAISKAGRQVIDPALERLGLNERGFLFILSRALQHDPQPISANSLDRQSPYFNREVHQGRLEKVAEAGFLAPAGVAPVGAGEYRLTSKGRSAMEEVNKSFYLLLGELPVLSPERLAALEELLGRLMNASLDAGEPAGKVRLKLVHDAHPKNGYGPLARVDQHLDDLLAFRDDAHLASWGGYGVSPQAWEAFTLVWRGEANDAVELAEALPNRGFQVSDYAQALQELSSKGWLKEIEGGFEVTGAGDAVRQEAEAETNRLFFRPWDVLDQQEVNRLRFLLARLESGLMELEATKEGTP